MKPSFRPCTSADSEWAYELKREAYQPVVERQFGPWDEAFQRRLFAERWKPEFSRLILVDDQPVGLLAVRERAEEHWIDEIQLAAPWRGRGLGTLLIKAEIEHARTLGKAVSLQVLRENTRARNLYQRLGLRVSAETATHHRMTSAPVTALP
ncbi:MAG: GNAT family N-acetyltransferase [Candidatus Didemnitutus sp.]|nr:GNAT family N-acetyltransferase [Candidatus Didemnitutus sp.]